MTSLCRLGMERQFHYPSFVLRLAVDAGYTLGGLILPQFAQDSCRDSCCQVGAPLSDATRRYLILRVNRNVVVLLLWNGGVLQVSAKCRLPSFLFGWVSVLFVSIFHIFFLIKTPALTRGLWQMIVYFDLGK